MIIILGILIISLISLISLIIFNKIIKIRYIEKFDIYMGVLDFHNKKAYEIIYRDIMIYSVEAIKIDDDQFNVYAKKFASLVLIYLGPSLVKEFINIYGNEETFLFNLVDYFNTRYESDEIRKSAINNLVDKEQI